MAYVFQIATAITTFVRVKKMGSEAESSFMRFLVLSVAQDQASYKGIFLTFPVGF